MSGIYTLTYTFRLHSVNILGVLFLVGLFDSQVKGFYEWFGR